MVCQNQSIDESNAPLAEDLRILIRNQIKDGKNDEEIYKFLTDRYGDFILLKPAFKRYDHYIAKMGALLNLVLTPHALCFEDSHRRRCATIF